MAHTILIVDDNPTLLLGLKRSLSSHYKVELAQSGTQALDRLGRTRYQCVILDLGLLDMSGLDVCQKLRQAGNCVPIIVLSGDGEFTQKAELLDAGADDYLTKPVNIIELKARLRTAIRHAQLPQPLGSSIAIQGVRLDSLRHTVERDGIKIELRPKEFSLLECLMGNAGHVVSRATLLQYGWEPGSEVWESVVGVHIKYLRDKLDYPFDRPLIKTVHGLGYKFDASSVATIKKGEKI